MTAIIDMTDAELCVRKSQPYVSAMMEIWPQQEDIVHVRSVVTNTYAP